MICRAYAHLVIHIRIEMLLPGVISGDEFSDENETITILGVTGSEVEVRGFIGVPVKLRGLHRDYNEVSKDF